MSLVFGSVSPSSRLSGPDSIVSNSVSPYETRRDAYKGVLLASPRAGSGYRSGTVLRSIEQRTWSTELGGLGETSQRSDASKEEASSCAWQMHNPHVRQRHNRICRGTRVGCIRMKQLFWCDRGERAGTNDPKVHSLHSYGRISNKSRCHCKAHVQDAHFHYRCSAKFASAHLMFGAILGISGNVAAAATRDMTVRGMGNATVSVKPGVKIEGLEVSETGQAHLFSKNTNVSVLKIEGLEPSKASPSGDTSRVEQQLSSNYESEYVKRSDENLSRDGFLSHNGVKLSSIRQQIDGKLSDVSHWWKDIHEAYREDTGAWGFGTKPIFTIYEGPGERVERVTIDEKEIQRRAGIEPLLPDFADEANKALAQERIMRAKAIAQDIEVGNMQPVKHSTLFTVIKHRNNDESQHTYKKVFNHIGSAAHTAAPVIRSALMVVGPVYGLSVLLGAYELISKGREEDSSKEEDSAARLLKMRKLKAQMVTHKDQKGEDTQGSTQSLIGPSDFVKKLKEVREMANKLRSGEGLQTPVKAEASGNSIPVVGNELGSQKQQSAGDKADVKVLQTDTETEVSMDIDKNVQVNCNYNLERLCEKGLREGQDVAPENGRRTLENELESARVKTDRRNRAASGSSQASGLIDQGNSLDNPSKPSFGIKPRVILSPEEARKTIAARKKFRSTSRASDVNHDLEASNTEPSYFNSIPITDETITDGTTSSSLRVPHSLGNTSATNNMDNEPSELSSSAWSGSSNSGSKQMQSDLSQTTNFEERDQKEIGMKQNDVQRLVSHATEAHDELAKTEVEDVPDWMKNEALREVVFKVRDNEEAGREPFFGLDSDKEKLFFDGIFERIKMEEERMTKRMKDGRENVDYGLSGIGVGDPPEEHLPHWKDPNEAVGPPLLDKAIKGRQKVVGDDMGIPQSKSSSSSANIENLSSSGISSSPSFFDHSDSKIPGEVQSWKPRKILSRNPKNKSALSSRNTVVVGSGKPLRKEVKFENTKRWGKELQKRYDSERDPEMRELLKEIGSELDSWVTEKEVEDAWRLSQELEQGEEEHVRQQYKSAQEKIQKQKQRFGLQAVLDKYKEYQPEREDQLWWLDLHSVLCVFVIPKGEEGGLYSLDMTLDLEETSNRQAKHVIAFQDRKDAVNFCCLLQLRSESKFDHAEVHPFSPKQLYKIAKMEGFKVTVLKEGQIQASVSQTLEEVEESILEIGRSVYWDQLEDERSIDVDSIVDQGFGL